MNPRIFPTLLCALCVCLAGCSSKQDEPGLVPDVIIQAPDTVPAGQAPSAGDDGGLFYPGGVQSMESLSLDDYDDDDEYASIDYSDPLQGWNRVWFRFNDVALLHVVKPVYTGYARVTPVKVRSGISNFAYNLKAPLRMVNSILQGKFAQTGVEFGQFFINTVTSLGFADVASRHEPRYIHEPHKLNFGHTLAYWGLPSGPYIIWPLIGPTTVRGTAGTVGDAFLTPQTYVVHWGVNTGTGALFAVNNIGGVINAYETMNRMALEPYAALRNGYFSLMSQREANIADEPGFRSWFGD